MSILDRIKQGLLFLDGSTGTEFQNMGLAPGECTEIWNISHPKEVSALHEAYYRAGSDVVNTNTFGINGLKYTKDELTEMIHLAVDHAKAARERCRDLNKDLYIALDIGPTGKLLKPLGDLDFEDAVALFADVVKIGASLGVDLVSIETMNDCLETKAALLAVKENCDLPVFVTNVYDKSGKLMTGANPLAMVAMLEGMGADAIGLNCSLSPADMLPIVKELTLYASVPVIVKPNAGIPEMIGNDTVYSVDASTFAKDMKQAVALGARIVGGCCGTDPAYIKALKKELEGIDPLPLTDKQLTVVSSYTHGVLFSDKPVLIGERINPTGKKVMQEALRNNNMDYLLGEAVKQQDAGAQILDVNVGLPGIDEAAVMCRAVSDIQSVTDLPLQIDSGIPEVLEKSLRRYNGKALVNSVNGKQEVMDSIFPIVQKYGGTVIGLTIDEEGIPDNANKRVQIALRIIEEAKKYGIDKKDIIIDPLTMTVSSDNQSAVVTLQSIRDLHAKGIKTILGVSNISFGLPRREIINSYFFTMAMQNGLSAAIMNPYSIDMMNSYYSFLTLSGLDENCRDYIEHSVSTTPAAATVPGNIPEQTGVSDLYNAIVKGMKDQAGAIAKEVLKTVSPLDLIDKHIVPALDHVGKGFEEKTVFLPGLLMAAEAAKSAFDEVKAGMTQTAGKYSVVLATVKGDIHDIGKNIVKVLLENYGFDVIDLGKDVPPETVVGEVVKRHVKLVGLSALMTTTLPAMEETVNLLKDKAPYCKIVVGGAVMNAEYARKIGADKYTRDAMDTVRYAESLV